MTDDTLLPFDLPSVRRKKLTIDFDGGNQSSNGGLLLLARVAGVNRLSGHRPDIRSAGTLTDHCPESLRLRRSSRLATGLPLATIVRAWVLDGSWCRSRQAEKCFFSENAV